MAEKTAIETCPIEASLNATVERGAETWQFFAFVFGAFAALGLSLIDSLKMNGWLSLLAKLLYFALCAYFLLFNLRVRNKLVSWLGRFKSEDHGRIA